VNLATKRAFARLEGRCVNCCKRKAARNRVRCYKCLAANRVDAAKARNGKRGRGSRYVLSLATTFD